MDGTLKGAEIEWDSREAVCVVMASQGYPGSYKKGHLIEGLNEAISMDDVVVFHAGTTSKGEKILTNGGRVLGVTGLGHGVSEAIQKAYQAVERIRWEGVYYRRDIGKKALDRLGS